VGIFFADIFFKEMGGQMLTGRAVSLFRSGKINDLRLTAQTFRCNDRNCL